ncbi:ankyrin repeat [Anaeramoeba flamelloides]|uniref:Ankyrin repeat n=1 Tax=Anaeramoeba flamelloides TaxID=1746091 RepID=A0ABQ8XA96_9EUKA|nr:ankyrin repeat [Anaeramoeba flamelloides]
MKSEEMCNYLIEKGANVNARTNSGFTILHYALGGKSKISVVRNLLEHGANPNGETNTKQSCLQFAIQNNCPMISMKLVVEYGGEIKNIGGDKGKELQEYSKNVSQNKSSYSKDFLELFKSKKLADCTIDEIPCHKLILETRLGKAINQIEEILIDYSKEEKNIFLEWAYSGIYQIKNIDLLKKIAEKFGIAKSDFRSKSLGLVTDLSVLYTQENSKDFFILVKDDVNEEDEENEEEEYEEIPVHKLFLQARSGLFREMFGNVTENSNKVKDFSGKTIESIEIFIKFLYTDSIVLTADDDPILIVEELSDAAEYYQLSSKKKLEEELKEFSKNN